MFGERVRAHARADATVINLNDLCQSFFLLGKRLVALYVRPSRGEPRFQRPLTDCPDATWEQNWGRLDDDETAKLLVQTFNDRLQVVMDVSQHSGNQDVTSRVNKLDLTELRRTSVDPLPGRVHRHAHTRPDCVLFTVFQLGAASAQEFQRWKNRQASRLLPSDAAVGSNPRKRPFGSS